MICHFCRVNLSDRKALFVVGMAAHALGHPLTNVSVSSSTIRQSRMENCEVVTSRDKSFSPSDPLLLHWDTKLLPDIAGGQHKVDRVVLSSLEVVWRSSLWSQHSEPVQGRMSYCSSVNGHLLTDKSSHLPAMISSSLMTCNDCATSCSCTVMMQ